MALGWLEGRLIANWTPWNGWREGTKADDGDALGKLRADARIFIIPRRALTGAHPTVMRAAKSQKRSIQTEL